MRREEFEAALERYGARIERWPEALRAPARDRMKTDPAAARALQALRAAEEDIARAVAPQEVDAALVGRVVASVTRGPDGAETTVRPTPRLFAWAGAATAASLMLGFALGLSLPATDGEDAVAGIVFGAAYAGDEDGVL